MIQLHALAGWALATAGALLLVGALAGVALPDRARVISDRILLAVLLALGFAALSGLPLIVITGGPPDILHFVYALAAPVVVVIGRVLAARGRQGRFALLMVATGVALLGVIFRLFTTG